MKNSSDTIGNRTRNLPVCRAVPQPTALPAACSLSVCIPKSIRTIYDEQKIIVCDVNIYIYNCDQVS